MRLSQYIKSLRQIYDQHGDVLLVRKFQDINSSMSDDYLVPWENSDHTGIVTPKLTSVNEIDSELYKATRRYNSEFAKDLYIEDTFLIVLDDNP